MKAKYSVLFLLLVSYILFQQCTHESLQTDYDSANGKKGGIYYDTFWASEGDFDQKDTAKINKLNTFAAFYSCNHCHGWDLKANKGASIDNEPDKESPNVSADDLLEPSLNDTPEELFHLIKEGDNPAIRRSFSANLSAYDPQINNKIGDQMPKFSELLSDQQIWDIVKFLKTESIKVEELYDYSTSGNYPTGTISFSNHGKGGDMARGKAAYVSKGCAASSCHGAKGTTRLLDDNTSTLSGFVQEHPYEAHHKIKFGELGSSMGAQDVTLQDLKDIYKALTDTIAFPLNK